MASSTSPSPTRDTIVLGGGELPDAHEQMEVIEDGDTSQQKVEVAEVAEAVQELSNSTALPAKTDAAPPTYHANDIHRHYWEPQVADNANDLPSTFVDRRHHGTINASASDPKNLKYILLFRDANPRWESDGIIFVKSSIRILPDGERFKDDPQPEAKKKRGFFGQRKSKKWSKGGRQERKWDKPRDTALNRKGANAAVDGVSQDAQAQKSLVKDEVVDTTNVAVKHHDASGEKTATGEQEGVPANVDSTKMDIEKQPEDGENKPTTGEDNAVKEVGSGSRQGEAAKPVDSMESDADAQLEKVDQKTRPKEKQAATELDNHNGIAVSQEADRGNAEPSGHNSPDASTHQTQGAEDEDEDEVYGSSEPPYTPDMSLFSTGPIAIFEQTDKSQHGGFRFAGYYKIARLQYLAPHTRELSRMLEQKFSTVDRFGRVKQRYRTPESWEASLSQRWAVIKMEMDEEACSDLLPPAVKIWEVKGKEAKDRELKDGEDKDGEVKDREAKDGVGAAPEQNVTGPQGEKESKD